MCRGLFLLLSSLSVFSCLVKEENRTARHVKHWRLTPGCTPTTTTRIQDRSDRPLIENYRCTWTEKSALQRTPVSRFPYSPNIPRSTLCRNPDSCIASFLLHTPRSFVRGGEEEREGGQTQDCGSPDRPSEGNSRQGSCIPLAAREPPPFFGSSRHFP